MAMAVTAKEPGREDCASQFADQAGVFAVCAEVLLPGFLVVCLRLVLYIPQHFSICCTGMACRRANLLAVG